MNSDQWRSVREVFSRAVELAPAQRRAFLDTHAPDVAVRREVESLLQADADADAAFLAPPDLFGEVRGQLSTPERRVGETVGHYRITGLLGIGGMGAVYRAERVDGHFEHTVALKVVRAALLSDDVVVRFHREQRVLARLTHPNIARLYDGGLTGDGVPYVVLELVEGTPITDYVAEHALDMPARVRLFIEVCRAVQYAHQNLVVHRDLKPSNVLVTEEGAVKLLDFGIARLLEEDDDTLTQVGQRPFTPAYASPEQVRGEVVTTASDVYSLGVLLYEVLTGRRPYDLTGLSSGQAEKVVCETEPVPPSAHPHEREASAVSYKTLPGDLDAITLMALRKDPAHRYTSVQALAEDLDRHLRHLPVVARPATVGYRVRAFVRRHRAAVAGAAALALALVLGLGATLWQGHRAAQARAQAERRFAIANDAARTLLFDVHDAIADLPGATTARELVVGHSLGYLRRLAAEAGGDAMLRLDLSQAYLRIGNAQGSPHGASLGQLDSALARYREGLAVLPRTVEGDSLTRRLTFLRGLHHEKMADVYAYQGRLDDALAHLDTALARYAQNADREPPATASRVVLAIGHLKRGDFTGNPSMPNAGQPAGALAHYARAAQLLRQARAEGDTTMRVERMEGLLHEREGGIYLLQRNLSAARTAYHRSAEIRQKLAVRYPQHTDVLRDLAVAFEKLGQVDLAEGQRARAVERFGEATRVFEQLADADPENAQAQQSLAISLLHEGQAHLSGGNRAMAARVLDRARQIVQRLAEKAPGNTQVQNLVGEIDQALAQAAR